jgi:hypothetical protein
MASCYQRRDIMLALKRVIVQQMSVLRSPMI